MTTALLDRLTRHCQVLETGNDSYRFKHISAIQGRKRSKTKKLSTMHLRVTPLLLHTRPQMSAIGGRHGGSMSQGGGRNEDTVRAHIEDWPYTSHYLQRTLDPALIAHHGRALLLRSLNNGRLVCFVGSGVSMAYGRLGWGDMVRAMEKERDPRPGEAKGSTTDTVSHPMDEAIRGWLRELNLGKRSGGDDLQSGRYPAAFQFLEQIEILQRALTGQEGKTLRDEARIQLFDDRGHAFHLIRELQGDLEKVNQRWKDEKAARELVGLPTDAKELRRDAIDPRAERPPDVAWRDRFLIEASVLDAASSSAPGALAGSAIAAYLVELKGFLELPDTHAPQWTPLLRFVSVALARLGGEFQSRLLDERTAVGDADDRRRSMVQPQESDPLLLLARNLRIDRFITTNYDLDIERLLRDRGFALDRRNKSRADSQGFEGSTNPLGARSRDALFEAERAGDLIDFAIHGTDHAYSVIHLHGRATDEDSMVITDEDYLKLYLQRGDDVEMTEHALSLTFGANPLLFVGSGMSEDDILRPLRQFVPERRSRVDRQAVVLLPADGSRARQIEEVIALYSRYGVHTMHFGIGADASGQPVRWLAGMLHLLRACRDIIDHYLKVKPTPDADAKVALARATAPLIQTFSLSQYLGFDKVDGADEANLAALGKAARPLWEDLDRQKRRPTLHLPASIDIDAPKPLDGRLGRIELATLNAVVQTAFDIALWSSGVDLAAKWLGVPATDEPRQAGAKQVDLDQVLRPLPQEGGSQGEDRRRMALSCLALARGLPGALIGLAMCAKLLALEAQLQHWRLERNRLPSARSAGGPEHEVTPARPDKDGVRVRVEADKAKLLTRHPLALRDSPWPGSEAAKSGERSRPMERAPDTDRFFSDAPSQTFQAFLGSLRDDGASPEARVALAKVTPEQRRVFVLYSDRGVGKGHFFEALRTERRLGEFIQWSWPATQAPVRYAAFAYFNLSFSLEVVSAFDRISDLLTYHAPRVFPDAHALASAIKDTDKTLSKSRVARLQGLIRLYASRDHGVPTHRLLIALSPFNILFDERGDPKNAELHRLVAALLGPEAKDAPIDLLLLCSGSPFPAPFRQPDPLRSELKPSHRPLDGWTAAIPRFSLDHLVRGKVSAKGRRRVEDTITRLQVNVRATEGGRSPNGRVPRGEDGADIFQGAAWFHVLREARTANTLAKYFPEVALSLALHPGALARPDQGLPTDDKWHEPLFADRQALDGMRNRILERSATFENASEMVMDLPAALSRAADRVAAQKGGLVISADGMRQLLDTELDREAERQKAGLPVTEDRVGLDEDSVVIYRSLERSRYLVTLACAAVAELAWSDTEPDRGADGNRPVAPQSVTLNSRTVVQWWLGLFSLLTTSQANDKGDHVVSHVLEHYHDLHERQHHLPIEPQSNPPGRKDGSSPAAASTSPLLEASVLLVLRGPFGWALQQRLLWHLAVVGHPVEADVLALAPLVVGECDSILRPVFPKSNPVCPSDAQRLAVVEYVLDVMVHRCLIFRLEPAKVGNVSEAIPAATEAKCQEVRSVRISWRFTPHRFMQRAIFRKLHAPHVEHASVDQFGLSMWATQPDDLPRPNRLAAQQVSDVLACWTGAPKDPEHIMRSSTYHRALREAREPAEGVVLDRSVLTLPARLLRASLGVVRTVYSVGVVSRFHDYTGTGHVQAPVEGYFEQHRLQVRWLIEQARALCVIKPLRAIGEASTPLFAEEIVWLYNECGLFCLVQGRLDSAAGLFGIALRAAQRVEGGDRHGALWCRIQLNLIMADIERGRIREARKNLASIISVGDENPILRLLVRGYQGLVSHYSGNAEAAETIFTEVIEDLDKYGQSRSVAIFARHLSELYRLRGQEFGAKALAAVDRSIAAATKGGHEDVRQMARLSRVRLAIDKLLPDESESIPRRLDEIEKYGVEMGMPRLVADTAFARASHLLRLGETRHATQLACACIRVATANQLRLRQMTAIALLGRICERRGMTLASRRLLARAFEMAEHCDYSNVRANVRREHP